MSVFGRSDQILGRWLFLVDVRPCYNGGGSSFGYSDHVIGDGSFVWMFGSDTMAKSRFPDPPIMY